MLMYQNEIEIIKSRIENKHQGDEKQLEIPQIRNL